MKKYGKIGKQSRKRAIRCCNAFELPPEVLVGGVNLSVYENCGLLIQHYTELLTYTDTLIKVDTEIGIIRLEGSDFLIADMDGESLSVTGIVNAVFYERETKKE